MLWYVFRQDDVGRFVVADALVMFAKQTGLDGYEIVVYSLYGFHSCWTDGL